MLRLNQPLLFPFPAPIRPNSSWGRYDACRPMGGKEYASSSVYDDRVDIGEALQEGEAFLRAQDENGGRQGVCIHAQGRHDGNALAFAGRLAGRGRQDMMIPFSFLDKEFLVIP